jgi:four helix bundle protein
VGDYRKLQVWERARRLTLDVYESTRSFPKDEMFGLTSQLRRAASSIPANIAEGCGRNGDAELARFPGIAIGSANELDYHLLLARDLGYLPSARYEPLAAEVQALSRMIATFIERLRQPNGRQPSVKKLIADSR